MRSLKAGKQVIRRFRFFFAPILTYIGMALLLVLMGLTLVVGIAAFVAEGVAKVLRGVAIKGHDLVSHFANRRNCL